MFGLSSVRIEGGATHMTREVAKDLARLGYKVTHIKQAESESDEIADSANLPSKES